VPADVQLYKHKDHHHFFIKSEVLYESYNTIRGLKYQKIMLVSGMPNENKCDETCLRYISKEFLNQKI